MPNCLTKFLNVTLYKGKHAERLRATLGLDLAGHAQLPGSTAADPRLVHLPVLEGLTALLSGHVRQVTLEGSDDIWFTVSREAYAGSHVAAKATIASDVHAGYNRTAATLRTTVPSTSATAKQGEGKTEFSVVAGALVEAALRSLKTNGQDSRAASLMAAYRDLAKDLCAIGTLPLGATGPRANPIDAVTKSRFESRLGELSCDVLLWLNRQGDPAGAETAWRTELVAGRPTSGPLGTLGTAVSVMARGLVGPGCTDFAQIFTDIDLLERIPRGASLPVAVGPPVPATPVSAPGHSQGKESELARAVRWASAARMHTMLMGPPGTGKTWEVTHPTEPIPVVRISMSSESDVALAIGDYGRAASGDWVPRLGTIARTVRYAQLSALLVAFGRGRKASRGDAPFGTSGDAADVWDLLMRLEADPHDPAARGELDARAWPYYPETWKPVRLAYARAKAATIGHTARLFVDEIFHAARNQDMCSLLQVLLEDEMKLNTERGGSGWVAMNAYNVSVAVAGNPTGADELSAALRSRFAVAIGVPYPPRDRMRVRHRAVSASLADDAEPSTPDESHLELVGASYEPYRFPIEPASFSDSALEALMDFGEWSRAEARARRLFEGLDTRGEGQVNRLMVYLLTSAEADDERDAFRRSAALVVDRLCDLDDLGLPIQAQRLAVTDKIAALASAI